MTSVAEIVPRSDHCLMVEGGTGDRVRAIACLDRPVTVWLLLSMAGALRISVPHPITTLSNDYSDANNTTQLSCHHTTLYQDRPVSMWGLLGMVGTLLAPQAVAIKRRLLVSLL